MKKCNSCREDKKVTEYHRRWPDCKDGRKRYRNDCRVCHNRTTTANNNKSEEAKKRHRLNSFKSRIKAKYGISCEEYQRLYEDQHGLCGICQKSYHSTLDAANGLYIDHCHRTGSVRELLCHNCNAGIGHFKEDITILDRAIEYIRRHYND